MQPESGQWAIVPIDIIIERAGVGDRKVAIARLPKNRVFSIIFGCDARMQPKIRVLRSEYVNLTTVKILEYRGY